MRHRLAWLLILGAGLPARGQAPAAPATEAPKSTTAPAADPGTPGKTLLERLRGPLSRAEDPAGTIDTDRPTFTPAATVVPRGRLQLESGFTFDRQASAASRTAAYDFPELGVRLGLCKRVEFRTFWLGQTDSFTRAKLGGPAARGGGPSDMEVGFKWQLLERDPDKRWRPATALITSAYAPTGGSSPLSSRRAEPYINLIYLWKPTDKLTLGGSTGTLGVRQQPDVAAHLGGHSYQRGQQSLLGFYSATKRATLFYEWYVLGSTTPGTDRPSHFMDGGVLYGLSPSIQLDLRAGFGLGGRPDEFFTGAGFSVRF